MEIDLRLIKIVAKHFNIPVEAVNTETSKDNVEDWDSLEHIKLILEIEDEFKMKFPLEKIPFITSIQAIKEELWKHFNGQ